MNRTGLLLGALVVVLFAAWLSGVFDSEYSTLDVPKWNFDRDEVEEIVLRSPSDTLVFSSKSGRWLIVTPVEAEADSIRLGGLLRDLEELSFGAVVSTNVDRHGRYGVDSTASSILVRSGDDARVLVVGNTGSDYRTVYMRLGEDDRVFSSDGRISVDAVADTWRDRTIISVPRDAVLRMEVDAEDQRFVLLREAAGWQVEEAGDVAAADSSAVERYLQRFAPLKGNGFVDQAAFDAASPWSRITFETVGGSVQGIEIRETATGLLARRPGTPDVLTVSSGTKNSLVPEASTLRQR